MASVHDVAAYILKRQGGMSAMKLQKLVYYSQAWSLARRGIPLFQESVRAWAHGPVVWELYEQHRGQFAVSTLPQGDAAALDEPQAQLVDWVLDRYGPQSAKQLSDLTHAERPWVEARGQTPPGGRSFAEISHHTMRAYYAAQPLHG